MIDQIDAIFQRINAIWPTARLHADNYQRVKVWREALDDVPIESVRAGYRALSKIADRTAPTPGRFRTICFDARRKQVQQQGDKDLQRTLAESSSAPRTPREEAWAATQAVFVRRLCGHEFANLIPALGFATDFDAEHVAASTPEPKSNSIEDHQAAFRHLKEIFELEWNRKEAIH